MEEEQKEIVVDRKKSLVKRLLKVLLYIVLTIIGLNVLLYALLSIPSVQQKVADFAINELKSILKTEVSIDEVRLSLFNHVSLKGVYVEDQKKDTLLYAHSLDATLNPLSLLKTKTLEITGVSLNDFVINVNRNDSVSDFNFQFVIDAFSSKDTVQTDTTKSSLVIVIEDIKLKQGRLNYDILSKPRTSDIFNASHISLYDFNANIDINSIDSDQLDIALNNFSVKEKSGIEINELKAHLFSQKSLLWLEGLSLKLPNSVLIATQAKYDLSTNEFTIGIDNTEIMAEDLTAFLPNLKFLKNKIVLKADVGGTLPAINIANVDFAYGNDCVFSGKAFIADSERYGKSDISLSIDNLRASQSAIASFVKLGDSTFITPDIVKDLGDIFMKGELSGRLNNFKLDVETWCRQGAVSLFASGAVDTTFTNFDITARLGTQNFNLGRLLNADSTGLGRLTSHINIKARKNNSESLVAQLHGDIDAMGYNKETLKNVSFSGYYDAKKMGLSAKTDWKIGGILVDVGMTQDKVPDINVRLKIDSLHIDPFYKNADWVNPRLTLALDGKIKGLDIDNIAGKVNIDSVDFHDDNFALRPKNFSLEVGKNADNNKFITLTSSYLSANVSGQYKFVALKDELSDMMSHYFPDVFENIKHSKKDQNDFVFNITAYNTEELSRIFALPVNIILPATISGHVNTTDRQINIKGNIPHVQYGNFNIMNAAIDIANADSVFNITAGSKILMDQGNYSLSLKSTGADNLIHATIGISTDSSDINIHGNLEASAQFHRNEKHELESSLKIIPSDIMIGKLALNLFPAEILNSGSRTEIYNAGIGVNKKKYLGIDGIISDQKTDSLKIHFDHAEVGELLEAFDIHNIQGCVHGSILLTDILGQLEVYTKGFEIDDIIVFSDTLGTLGIESQWSDEFGGVKLDAFLTKTNETYLELDGIIYTGQDYLDLHLQADRMPLGWIHPFFSDVFNKISGSISANLLVEGSMKELQTKGFLGFNDTQIGIDYTNVVYTISDTLRVSPDRIGLDNLILKDSQGNTANVSATVTHKNYENMKYSLNMTMDKLMLLNTENRIDSLFYGRLYASGTVKIDGDNDGVAINMQLKNDKNSSLNVLLPQHSEATDYESVVYINVPEEKLKNSLNNIVKLEREKPFPLKLNVKLDVTPELAIGVVIDPVTGDAMEAKGEGAIIFNYDMQSENMSTYGDYTLKDGNVKLNLQNLKTLQFKIQDGSKLNFIGNPLKTQFDIIAYRRLKPDLKTLDPSFEANSTSSKVEVDCILGITGNLDKMNLRYDINLPNAEDDVRRKVNSLISTDEQKIKQFAYLVATGSFYPSASGGSGANFSGTLWTGMAADALSGGLNSLFGNMLGDKWQIGTNIESNDGTLSDVNVSVDVSKKFLDDKLVVKTNLGYHTDRSSSAVDDSFIGNFDVEYQLNAMWTLKAYSHTNERYYIQAPTTQGIGIVYSKEAATLKRLFQSFKPRWRNRNSDAQPQNQPADSTQSVVEKQPEINDEKNK